MHVKCKWSNDIQFTWLKHYRGMRLDCLGRKIVVKMTFELLDELMQQEQAAIK